MNVSTTVNTTPAIGSKTESSVRTSSSSRACDTDRGEQRAAFESALRSKEQPDERGQRDGQSQDDPADAAAQAAQAASAMGLPPPLLHVVPAPPRATVAAATAELTGPRAAIEAALNAHVPMPITAVGEADPAALWEASVREPNAIAVDVRVMRAEKTAHEPQAALSVTVSSPTVDAEVLSRHTHRLNERLRKHGVEFTHARVERDEPEAE